MSDPVSCRNSFKPQLHVILYAQLPVVWGTPPCWITISHPQITICLSNKIPPPTRKKKKKKGKSSAILLWIFLFTFYIHSCGIQVIPVRETHPEGWGFLLLLFNLELINKCIVFVLRVAKWKQILLWTKSLIQMHLQKCLKRTLCALRRC